MSADRSNNPWLFDLRLRERNVRSGALDEKELNRHLSALKDLEAETETFGLAQPAIGDGLDEEIEDDDVEAEAADADNDNQDAERTEQAAAPVPVAATADVPEAE